MAKRPGSVTFVAVLAYLNGILNIIGGIVLLLTRDSNAQTLDAGGEAGLITAGILSILLGIVILIVAKGLLDASRISRGLVAVVMIVNIVNGVLQLFSLRFFSGVVEVLWAILIVSLLFTRRANAFFSSRPVA